MSGAAVLVEDLHFPRTVSFSRDTVLLSILRVVDLGRVLSPLGVWAHARAASPQRNCSGAAQACYGLIMTAQLKRGSRLAYVIRGYNEAALIGGGCLCLGLNQEVMGPAGSGEVNREALI